MTSAAQPYSNDRATPSFGWPGPLLLAIAASIVLHLTLIFATDVELPNSDLSRLRVLEARLEPLQAREPVSEPTAPPMAESPRATAKAKRPKRDRVSVRQPPASPPMPQPVSQPASPPLPEPSIAPASEPIQTPAQIAEISPELNSSHAHTEVPAPQPVHVTQTGSLPNNVLIRFIVNWGVDGLNAGKTDFIWQSKGTHYSLSSVAQYAGLVGLFKSDRILETSLGEIKDGVLRPNFFTLQRGQSHTTSETATFDWPAGVVTFSDGEKNRAAPLKEGAQDILSLLFQFAFTKPPDDQFTLLVVNGRKTESYPVIVAGEQMLNLPFGQVRTVHLTRLKTAEDDGLQIWLASDRHYLPVKIYFEDRKGGQTIELVATELLASDDPILRPK